MIGLLIGVLIWRKREYLGGGEPVRVARLQNRNCLRLGIGSFFGEIGIGTAGARLARSGDDLKPDK